MSAARRVADALWLAAAAATALLAGAWAVSELTAGWAPPPGVAAAPSARKAPREAPQPSSRAAVSAKGARPSLVRPTLAVDAAEARAEVRVDGHLVGRTPLLSEVTCALGDELSVEVTLPPAPTDTAPRTKLWRGPCRAGRISISVKTDP